MAVTFISNSDVRNECAGIIGQVSTLVPDIDLLIERTRKAAINDFERDCETYLQYRRVEMNPDPALVKGTDYDVEETPHDYVRMSSMKQLPQWIMRRRPIKWGTIPHIVIRPKPGTEFFTIPDDWIRADYYLGIIDLFPVTTMNVVFGAWPAFVMAVMDSSMPYATMPHFVSISYTAGWYDEETDTELPQELDSVRDTVMGRIRWRLYQSLGDMIPNTQTLDGFTQNFDSVDQRMKRLEKAYNQFTTDWRARYSPPAVSIV